MHGHIARDLDPLVHEGLRFRFHILDQVRQEVDKEGLCGDLEQDFLHLRTEVRFKVLVYESLYSQTLPLVPHFPLQTLELLYEHGVECIEILRELAQLLILLRLVLVSELLLLPPRLLQLLLSYHLLRIWLHLAHFDNFLHASIL